MALTSLYLEADFGVGNTGLAGTVGYTLLNAAGGVVVARATTPTERGSSGVYGVTVPTIAESVASILWDTGGGSPLYASEDIPSVIRQVAAVQQYSEDTVWYDNVGGSAGTEWPIGSGPANAVDNYTDLVAILTATGLKRVRIVYDAVLTLGGSLTNIEFVGVDDNWTSVDMNGQTLIGCRFDRLYIDDGAGGTTLITNYFYDCRIAQLWSAADSSFHRCYLANVSMPAGGTSEFVDCFGSTSLDMGGGAASTITRFRRFSGRVVIDNMDHASSRVFFSGQEGSLVVNVSNTLGQIFLDGVDVEITDNSGGTAVLDQRGASLSEQHGAGGWETGAGIGAQDVRDAMKLAPTVGAAAAGSIDEHLDDMPADVDTTLTGSHGAGSWQTGSGGFDAIYCDPTNGNDVNAGTPTSPVLTLAQAITNAAAAGLSKIIVTSDTVTTGILLAVDPGGVEIVSTNVAHQINMSAVTLTGTTFVGFEITGTYTVAGAGPQFHNCSVSGGDVSGTWYNSRFSSTCTVLGGAICIGCESTLFNTFDLGGGSPGTPLLLFSHSGDVTLSNSAAATQLVIVRADGYLELNLLSSISDISLEFGGNIHLVDGSVGGTITDFSIPMLVDGELTTQHGAGSWIGTAITSQDVRDAMKLAPTGGAPAAGSVDEHLDTIEADTADMQPRVVAIETDTAAMQPTVATNLDATVSSRATQADILSDATPFPGANIDATITSRESDTAAAVRTSAIQADIAALALATPTAADIADAVLEEDVSAHSGVAGSLAELVEFIFDVEGGRWKIDTGTDQMIFYKADNVTEIARVDLKDLAGSPTSSPSSITERTRV